jgi:hypothetical protein
VVNKHHDPAKDHAHAGDKRHAANANTGSDKKDAVQKAS